MNRYKSSPMHLPRHLFLGLSTILSIVTLALFARLLTRSSTTHAYQVLGIITSALSLLILLNLICLPRLVFVLSELITLFFLWILWTATVALTIQARNTSFGNTECTSSSSSGMCSELTAAEALSIIIFGLLLLYLLGLLCHGTFLHHRNANQGVWYRRMNDRGDNYGVNGASGCPATGQAGYPAASQPATMTQPATAQPAAATANTRTGNTAAV